MMIYFIMVVLDGISLPRLAESICWLCEESGQSLVKLFLRGSQESLICQPNENVMSFFNPPLQLCGPVFPVSHEEKWSADFQDSCRSKWSWCEHQNDWPLIFSFLMVGLWKQNQRSKAAAVPKVSGKKVKSFRRDQGLFPAAASTAVDNLC